MNKELEDFLNTLCEAERAGGRVLHELTAIAPSPEMHHLLRKAGHDEGYWAGELAAQLRRLGGQPSNRTGDFVEKVRAVGDFRGKLELLNRGQRWVIRKINEQLPSIGEPELAGFLKVMAQGHEVNIAAVEEAMKKLG